MRTARAIACAVALVALATAGVARSAPVVPGAEWLLDQVKALTAPGTDGRATATPGGERAARHIASVFRDAGLAPGGDAGGYLQAFGVPTGIRLGTGNVLAPAGGAPLVLGRDFAPLAASADGDVTGDLVFAGYGTTAPELGYDDYAGLDARDKIVLVLDGEPRRDDPASPFRRPTAYHYSQRTHKIINARQHGARAVIVAPRPTGSDTLPDLRGTHPALGIVAIGVTRATGDALLAPLGRPADLAAAIDGALAPRSRAVPGSRVRVGVGLVRERGIGHNVIGVLPGADPSLAREAIVIGAHYDHLGHGGEGSLAPDQRGAIHPGADDNASGTAVVMGLARAFAAGPRLPRTLVLVAFAGEEMGLLGSAHYAQAPSTTKPVLMINLDMVGRLRDGTLYVGGVDSGDALRSWVTAAARGLSLAPELSGNPFAPSDHTAFYTAGVPVLFLFTGGHEDYHRPADTWEKINAAGLETIATLTARIVETAATAPAAPVYARVEPSSPAGGERRGGYGPVFGIVPAFGDASGTGARISGVRPGSPAEKAGMRAGDVIVKFGGVPVQTLEDLTFALRGQRAGQRVEVEVVRDGGLHRVEAVLEERR